MRSTALGGLGVFAAIAMAITAACSSDDSSGGGGPPVLEGGTIGCPANAKECVNDHLARVCPADGSAWLSEACTDNQKCVDGACTLDTNAQCSPALDTCSGDTALRCKPDGKGYEVTKCPPGTKCIGTGKCIGACEVGTSSCTSSSVVATCADGLQMKQTNCAIGQYCVTTGTNKADCMAGDCQPGTCDVCGNKIDPNADQTKFVSHCAATPNGYKWEAIGCQTGASCDPKGGSSCTGPYGSRNALCAGGCTPGATRCASTNTAQNGIETCDANGTWSGTVAPCNVDPTNGGLVCMTDPSKANSVLCGDPLCATYDGVCDETGKIKLCGPDRKVSANSTDCVTGTCKTATTLNGRAAGSCGADCKAGEEHCTALGGGNSYQTCNNGVWGAPQTCASGQCYGYTTPTGTQAKLCNATCTPGTHKCTSTTTVQTCSPAGQWGADATCAIGTCKLSGSDYACVADCIPNQTLCVGSPKAGVGQYAGTDSYGNCTADGKAPTTTTLCDGAKACRTNGNGIYVGCVECLGPNHGGNPLGVADSRCTDQTGATGYTTSTEYCQANDTWPALPVDCPQNTSCQTVAYACNSSPYAHDGSLKGLGYPGGCAQYFGSSYVPISCGSTPDCCVLNGTPGNSYCNLTGTGPATCK